MPARSHRRLFTLAHAGAIGGILVFAPAAAIGAPAASGAPLLKRIVSMPIADAAKPIDGRSGLKPAPGRDAARPAQGAPAASAVLAVDAGAYAAIGKRRHLDLDLPVESSGSIRLDLNRFDVLTPDARVVVVDATGEHEAARPDVQLWQGIVAGDPGSRAFVAITPRGAQGYVVSGERTYSISTVPDNADTVLAGRTVVTEAHALGAAQKAGPAPRAPWACEGAVPPPGAALPEPQGELPARTPTPPACRTIRVAIDSDTELTTNLFTSDTTSTDAAKATAYITQLMGAVSSIYERDVNTQIQVSFLRVWTTPSPYNAANTSAQLAQFRAYWNTHKPAVPFETAHMLSGRGLGGGIAYLSVLCNPSYAVGVSSNLNGTFPFPVQDNNSANWDLNVVAHELGHNFGTGHTHDPAFFSPPIDGCGNGYLNPPQTQDCTVAQQHNGTIMSYCHICPGGEANLKVQFGPRPSQAIRDYLGVNAASCGIVNTPLAVTSVNQTAGDACTGLSITITVTAVGPGLTYQWYRDGVLLPGKTDPDLTLTNLHVSDNGDYSALVSNVCGSVNAPAWTVFLCAGDFNCTGDVSVQDIFDYLAAWFSRDPRADINGVGGITVQDLFDFLGAFFYGC